MRAFTTIMALLTFITASSQEMQNRESIMKATEGEKTVYYLPAPSIKGEISVEESLNSRRSRRSFLPDGVTDKDLSQILWAAYGVTKPSTNPNIKGGLRTAPSAGARYPLEIYAVIGNIPGIEPGFYKYDATAHKIVMVIAGDLRKELTAASLNQKMIQDAPFSVFYSAVYSRITDRYGDRGRERYVCMDLGHSAQNVYLQAEALKLGTCAIGAFNDEMVKNVLKVQEPEVPLYLMPIGKAK
ncbi:MAG: SagB/ThcOx family dehydrogenase [Bacteroidales bacterium]